MIVCFVFSRHLSIAVAALFSMPRSPYRRRRSSSSSSSNSSNSKSRSRNKRNRSRSKSPRHHRGHTSRGQRSKSRESSRQRKNSVSPVPERPISSDDPKYLNARIFVGHLPSDRITREELEKHFLPYGNILGEMIWKVTSMLCYIYLLINVSLLTCSVVFLFQIHAGK